jgi:hypothetical protein
MSMASVVNLSGRLDIPLRFANALRTGLLALLTDWLQQAFGETIAKHRDAHDPTSSAIEPDWTDQYCPREESTSGQTIFAFDKYLCLLI